MLCLPSTVAVAFEGRPVAVHRSPRVVHQLIGDEVSLDFVRDAILLTNELVISATNDSDRCELAASFDGRQLRVEVADVATSIPVLRHHQVARGVGLRLVHRVASCWGAKVRGGRAIVWFELDALSYRAGRPASLTHD
jgi:hypothetical protein